MEKEYLTTKQVAEALQMDVSRVYDYLHKGLLKGYKIGSSSKQAHWRVAKEDLKTFIEGESK